MLPAGGDNLTLADIGMIFNLAGEQRLGALSHGLVEQSDSEVRHTNILRQPLAPGLGQRAKRLLQRHIGLRPVNQQLIYIGETERL
jgi:hypothetical protein